MLLPALGISHCLAQSVAPADRDFTISLNVEQVLLNVTVHDKKGSYVPNLPRESFQVFEEGRPEKIEYFLKEDVPVTMGVVIDASRSMRPKYREVLSAVIAFIQASNPDDQTFLVHFNEQARLSLPAATRFTDDVQLLRTALLRVAPDGQTALYDAIHLALKHAADGTWDKRVLVVLSDGGDNASRIDFDQLFSHVTRSDTIVYAIGLADEFNEDRNPKVLKRLSRATGGRAYFPRRLADVVEICKSIAEDIRSQYLIGYTPDNLAMDGTFRRIRVAAQTPEGRRLAVRTREGYYARRER